MLGVALLTMQTAMGVFSTRVAQTHVVHTAAVPIPAVSITVGPHHVPRMVAPGIYVDWTHVASTSVLLNL